MSSGAEIAVLGAGPAGAAAALGLARLGYDVWVVSAPHRSPRRESLSRRVVDALGSLGLREALATLADPCPRLVRWGDTERELPGEAQVERAAFDAGLLADLESQGLRVLSDEVRHVAAAPDGARVALARHGALDVTLVVDARGRSAAASERRERGPETTCLVQRWRAPRGPAQILVLSLENGWLWAAADGQGELATQLAVDAGELAARTELGVQLEHALRSDPRADALLAGAERQGEAHARAATAVLDGAPVAGRVLRIGDAALTVDPLSGNGVFQALSTALVAPAVANTLLRRPEHAARARAFYAARTRDVFLRFAHVSRGFYASAAAHHGGPFWRARAAWPSDAGSPARAPGAPLALERKPVVCDGWIEEREVVVTPERPLGIWQIAGAEIAPIVRAAASGPEAEARALAPLPEPARASVRAWLRAHGGGDVR